MLIYLFPTEKPVGADQWHCITLTLEDPSSNVSENEGAGLSPSSHTNYLNMAFKMCLVTFKQGVWHEGVGPTTQFSHML